MDKKIFKTPLYLILIFTLLSCSKNQDNESESTEEIEEAEVVEDRSSEAMTEESAQLYLQLPNDNTVELKKASVVEEYSNRNFDKSIPINSDEFHFNNIQEATIIYSDSQRFYIELKLDDILYLSVHDNQNNTLDISKICDSKPANIENVTYYLVTPSDIRVKSLIRDKPEIYEHFKIKSNGKIEKVTKPQNIIDYFLLLPDRYLYKYFNGDIRLFSNLMSGFDWYHIFVSKDLKNIVDIKNGYVSLTSTMAMFNSANGPLFLLTNTAGGTCETYLYNYFLKYDQSAGQFIDVPLETVMPTINTYDLFENTDEVKKHFKKDQIGFELIPPQFGTIMTVKPFIDECGLEDPEILKSISSSNTKKMELKWDRIQERFLIQ